MSPRHLLLAAVVLLVVTSARAADYGAEINVDSEDDLYDLHASGVLDDDDFETLVDLFDSGVDLNTATRDDLYALPGLTYAQADAIIEYRKLDGFIEDPLALVQAGVVTQKELEQIAPFIVIRQKGLPLPVSGKASLRTRYAPNDPVAPPLLFKTRLKLPADLQAGLALTTTRARLGQVSWDESQQYLLAQKPGYSPQLPKAFLQWKSTGRSLTVGTFTLGFGERLTLDNTRRKTPDGVYPDDVVYNRTDLSTYCRYSKTGSVSDYCGDEDLDGLRITPDYSWPESFRGIAGSIEDLPVGSAKLDLHAFGSYQTRSIYYSEIYNRNTCADPHDSSDDCKAPGVFEAPDGLLKYKFVTLPNVFDELAGGGHASLSVNERTRIGLTGYYATDLWRVPGASLDFQEYARYPFNGPFGAIGMNGATRFGPVDLFVEAARSFNQEPEGHGGGYAIEQRSVYSQKKQELELSLRYYDRDFLNPYARPNSGADEFEGQRARNELGARLRYTQGLNEDWSVRASGDAWILPYDGKVEGTAGAGNFVGTARADFHGWSFFQSAAWTTISYKAINPCTGDVESLGDALNVFGTDDSSESSTVISDYCDPKYVRVTARAQLAPVGKWLTFAVQPSYKRKLDAQTQDGQLWFELVVRPTDAVKFRARTRYSDEGLFADDDKTERTSWSWVELTWSPARQFLGRLRYDVLAYLDQRASTLTRRPNPEHRFQLLVETKF